MGALASQLVVRRDYGSGIVTSLNLNMNVRVVLQPRTRVCCSGTSVTALRRISDLKMVTQCAMLEKFGMFLVLANKVMCPFVP